MKLRIGTLEAPGAAVAGPICETLTVVRFVEVASANVVCAVKPEVCPVAVRVKVTPASLGCTTKLSFVKLPFLSATEVERPVRIGCRLLMQDHIHGLAPLPAGAGNDDCLSRRVIGLVGGDWNSGDRLLNS